MEPKTIFRCFSVNFCMQLCTSISKNIQNKCLLFILIVYILLNINEFIDILFVFIAGNERDFVQLLATVANSPGSGWIEPVAETQTQDLLRRSMQILNTGQNQPFMHLEFQVKIIY